MKFSYYGPIVATVSLFAGTAGAATLDFTELGSGIVPATRVSIDGANLLSGGDSLFVGAGGILNSICALDLGTNSCANDLLIAFTADVSGLSFAVGGHDASDNVAVQILDGGGVALGSLALDRNGIFDLSSFGTVAFLFFVADISAGNGISYGDFDFDVVSSPPAVPLPAGLPLMLGGLGVLSLAGRRRKAAAPN